MAYKKKFKRGDKITSMGRVAEIIDSGGWIYWDHQPKHPSFIQSMVYRTVRIAIARGILWEAVGIKDKI